MGCFKSKEEREFELALANKDPATIALGENFLKSVLELKNTTKLDHPFKNILQNATDILNLDHKSEISNASLRGHITSFQEDWERVRELNARRTGVNVFTYSLFFPIGVAATVMGAMALHKAIIGIVTLTAGPWGMAALAVGFGFIGLAVAAYSAYQLYINIRLCKDSQLEEIKKFLDHIDPPEDKLPLQQNFSQS